MRPLRYGVLMILLFCSAAFAEPLLVLNTADISPLSSPAGDGINDRIVAEAFRRIGVSVKTVVLPSERALKHADRGLDDGNFVRVAGLDTIYPNLVRVPESLCDFEFAAFTNNPAISVSDWASLAPYDVGIVTGWKILEANVVGTRSMTKVKDPEALFHLLVHGRADLVLFDRLQGSVLVKRKGQVDVRPLEPLLSKQAMFLYLNRRHAELVPKIAATLREMKADGSFARIKQSVLQQWNSE